MLDAKYPIVYKQEELQTKTKNVSFKQNNKRWYLQSKPSKKYSK